MAADEMPFGEDITNPDSRTIPQPFHGRWGRNSEPTEVIEAGRIVFGGDAEDVVAVRFIDSQERIAIVTRQPDGEYALHYRGLESGKLVDLESMDWVLDRC